MTLEYTGSGSGRRYTIASKIKVAEAILNGTSMSSISAKTGVSAQTLSLWKHEFMDGLYTLDNTNTIIRKPKTSVQVALEEAKAKVARIEVLMAALEAEGIKVA